MRRIITGAVAALMLTGATACATSNAEPYSEAAPRADEVMVRVTNHNFNAVTVRALTGGQNIRLGTVETDREDEFVVPPTLNRTDLRFAVEAIGSSDRYVTQPLTVVMGSVVDMDVKQSMDLTTVTVLNP